ncbi:histidine kinase [Alistipes sp. OttesenSCG-928-B03]|nr:histidine kinase [Alistipes sp. OttesenSCG-928-B03]
MKKCKPQFDYFGKKHALSQAITLSLVVNCVLIMGAVYGRSRGVEINWGDNVRFFLWHFGCNVLLYFFLFRYNFSILQSRRKSSRMPAKAVVGTLLICMFVSPILNQLQWFALGGRQGFARETFMFVNQVKDMFLGVIVILVTRNIYTNYKREQAIIANQKLVEENIRTRFEALKSQLDPHFLFNSLNTLNGLIGVDDEKAQEYVDNLSSVFRYTLNNKTIQTLAEELEFVDSYVHLLKIRYGDNLRVEYAIDESLLRHEIMPISIQLLIENAVKHNVISNKSPLTIHVATTPDGAIAVSNRINPKAEQSPGNGVGLANLTDRYAILFHKSIRIDDVEGEFRVEVPLIAETEKSTNL